MKLHRITTLAFVAALLPLTAACGSDDTSSDAGAEAATSTAAPTSTSPTMSATTSGAASGNIVETATQAGQFTTLVAAVKAAKLDTTLAGEGPFTVFAPTDAAFKKIPAATLDTLMANPTGDLAAILKYHVVPGEVGSEQVLTMNGKTVKTVNGASLTVMVSGNKVMLKDATGKSVNVTTTDVAATNGVIHVIDGVLMPK